MSKISIGDNNKIVKANIGNNIGKQTMKKRWPAFLIAILTGLISGTIVMLELWKPIISFLDKLFKNLF